MNRRKALKLVGGLTLGALVPFGSSIASGYSGLGLTEIKPRQFSGLHADFQFMKLFARSTVGRNGVVSRTYLAAFQSDTEYQFDTYTHPWLRDNNNRIVEETWKPENTCWYSRGNSTPFRELVEKRLDEVYVKPSSGEMSVSYIVGEPF